MDKALKQRLVGATILIALAVIFLPMLLDGNGQDSMSGKMIEIPERPEVQFKTRRLPIGEQAVQRASQAQQIVEPVKPAPVADEPPGQVLEQSRDAAADSTAERTKQTEVPEAVADQVNSDPAPEPEPQPPVSNSGQAQIVVSGQAAATTPISPPAPGDWLVQVASFGDGANANRLANQLSELGHAPLIATAAGADGGLHRVRIGPFDSQTDAQQALEQVAQTVPGVKPRLLHTAGGESVSRPAGGFAVQVGSFSSPGNAEKLMVQLASLGINAFRERTDSAGGTIIKVIAGPAPDQPAAAALRDRIETETGTRGLVIKLPD